MCMRTRVRSLHGIEFETTQLSGENEGPTFFSPEQALEFCGRMQDEDCTGLPEPQVYTHPTTGAEVLEVWEDYYDSHIFHLTSEGLYNVSDMSWDE